jgi:hypothetical protein
VRSAARKGARLVADLIEAGLNEDAGRLALALLWALCRAGSEFRRVGLQPGEASLIVVMSDREQIGVRSRGERAPMLWDAGCDAMRAQIVSTTSNWRRDGRDANRDCWWDGHGRAHEVSHQNGVLSDRGRWPPRGRSSMTLITPPHSEQGGGSRSTVSLGADVGDSIFPRVIGSPPSARSERQRASFCARWPLARNPKWRMRRNPSGKAWSRKRRMNSSGFKDMVLTAPPSR